MVQFLVGKTRGLEGINQIRKNINKFEQHLP